MKLNISKEYIRSLRKVLKSKLNGGNLVRGTKFGTQCNEILTKYLQIMELSTNKTTRLNKGLGL